MRISDWSSDVCSSDRIGGTGVLTVGALLGMAAHLDGKGCTILDMTGMAQKGGAVASHIRIGRDLSGIYTSRLSDGLCAFLIASDMIVGSVARVLGSDEPPSDLTSLMRTSYPAFCFQTITKRHNQP